LCFRPGLSASEQKAIIKDRSPITKASKIKAPLLIINGAEDPIVPPNQAQNLAKLVEEAGVPVELKVYESEEHIFSKGTTLADIERRRYAWFEKYLADNRA
jgi:dipeptidyl aminopeptidase/acylaminoacyl peptidase